MRPALDCGTCTNRGDDGRKRLVGLACANAGGHAPWRGLPRDPGGRGACDVRLVTSDAHDGLVRAIMDVYPEALCSPHLCAQFVVSAR